MSHFVRQGLVDEYWTEVYPFVLGAGEPLFERRASLSMVRSKAYDSGVFTLRHVAEDRDVEPAN